MAVFWCSSRKYCSIATMVRFSCFNAHSHFHKPKKMVQPSTESMQKNLQDVSQIQSSRSAPILPSSDQLFLNTPGDSQTDNRTKHASDLSLVEHCCNLEDMKSKFDNTHQEVNRKGSLMKSQSLGCGLYQLGKIADNITEDETDPRFSCDGSNDGIGLVVPLCSKDPEANSSEQYKKAPNSQSFQLTSDPANNGSIFSIGEPTQTDKDVHENSDTVLSGEVHGDSSEHTPCNPAVMVKSLSVPNIGSSGSSSFKLVASQSRSSEDLHVLDMKRKDICTHESDDQVVREQAKDDNVGKTEQSFDDGYDSYTYSGLAKDWIMPVTDEGNAVRNLQGESSVPRQDELRSKDFKIKRIEEWVNDLLHCSPLEETNESYQTNDPVSSDVNTLNGLTIAKVDAKVTPGMEAAKKYISALSTAATTAQLANHGLVVIPFLSAFVSLKVLNLSGNAIVRITAGALPRGLHMLNLSKNNISTIEGLRELTRLRVLDLSYNRIFRIGHGLASCSTLKELYLAGNKISEVEGLHRLLKLNVLDLRFNKVSTAKCLGQLAANYNSLQAISLEGNPAQKNVGDEQLKKNLQGLLPHLAYFNRQPIKASSLKDAADRSVRLGISSHQFDRGLRSDHKSTRKGSHGLTRPSFSSTHARGNQTSISPKLSKGKHGYNLPPSGTKALAYNRHHFDFSSKLLNFRPDFPIRRNHSEGTLGAF
ncbi:Outer arm dynein light chain 1 protein, putative isoform 1 [Quillaja saponaria]|uniref:Outer arm dynein light chain 1 protein, putative isoform 1 n=1 Tax=Quillaja saponaria TaxID=32244 RepID=A0AAD7KZU8_QUISA|nr:Outer arm dynein light chain 1 protein, putative isoform 1 [Quillaja saponaria]